MTGLVINGPRESIRDRVLLFAVGTRLGHHFRSVAGLTDPSGRPAFDLMLVRTIGTCSLSSAYGDALQTLQDL